MKKCKLILLILAFVAISSSAFAGPYINEIYMTDADTSFARQSVANPIVYPGPDVPYIGTTYGGYGWNDQPWLYINPTNNIRSYQVSWWYNEANPAITGDTYTVTSATNIWHDLSNWSAPGGPRTEGWWNVRVLYTTLAGDQGSSITKFHVTAAPEPISAALFLIGGAGLVVARRKRRKK